MYKAVMKQVVIFLEKAQHSLELLGTRINNKTLSTPRSKSDHNIKMENSRGYNDTSTPIRGSSTRIVEIASPASPVDYFW